MEILYSDILPLGLEDGQKDISSCFREQVSQSDRIEIAVGYVSKASLQELDELVEQYKINNISLVIGMYYVDGIPESTYRTAMALSERWKASGIGEIRMTMTFKYHGKVYVFYKDEIAISGIIGSANLGALKLEANNRRQYEVSAFTTDINECRSLAELLQKLKNDRCSTSIENITNMPIIREINTSLTGVDTVTQIPQTEANLYERHKTAVSFTLPIKVPAFAERHIDDNKHYTKSNLNVSYAAPRSARKSRDWYETQFTVSKQIARLEGYPEKNKTFYVVTDDGYTFKAHTTSDGNKQFSAVGDELILGRWIKGRLAAAGLVIPVNDTQADSDRLGMITKEMLSAYGCDTLILTKTDQKMEDEEGQLLNVWFLSFESAKQQEGGEEE